ncbi:MAG: HAMP domain-containing histidine kinase, partial [Acidobacteria bacterium]|nr:HAMP domain-containing histidine kinase [Acidobacteriota bacterium]
FEDSEGCGRLRQTLKRQEPWSDIPILLLGGTGEAEAARVTQLLGKSSHVLILERPLAMATFLSAIDAALRTRRRQYEVRRLLTELAVSAADIARVHHEANRAKDEFIATLAHELRSPITAISGWIQVLRMADLASTDAADALSMIESSAKVQVRIIEDLMDVSRIVAGKVMIEPGAVDLAPLLANVVATFRPAAAEEGIHLSADIPAEPMTVWADEVRIQQVGWNLVSNAIKFTPRGGSVHVSLRREDGSAAIRVRDNGQGISPELLPHIFERYRQDEGVTKRARKGLGLGLSIVCHLVESHDGTIEAMSAGRGQGAEFTVTLPLHAGAAESG